MATTTGLLRPFGHVEDNPILLDKSVTEPVCEGFNAVLSSFQGLYLQYQKHHFVVEGSEFYSLHEFFAESYEAVQGHIHELGERLNGWGVTQQHRIRQVSRYTLRSSESRSFLQYKFIQY